MHELGIAKTVLEISKGELKRRSLDSRVQRITLKVGRMRALVAESLEFHFDVLKKDDPQFSTAKLDIQEIPVRVFCKACDAETTLEEPYFLCLKCGGFVEVRAGEELIVEGLEVAEGE